MGKRDLSLTPRIEDKRDKKAVLPPVHFRLPEIKQHLSFIFWFEFTQFQIDGN